MGDGWLAGSTWRSSFVVLVKIFFVFLEAPLDDGLARDQGSGIPRRVQHVEPTYCHESCPPQAARGATDLDVQKSSPLQGVDVD
jgi:hypothetical protein